MIKRCDPGLKALLFSLIPSRRDELLFVRLCCSAFIVALPLLAATFSAHQARAIHARERENPGKLYGFEVAKPNFLVDGANLSKVEVWFWPTGTGITKAAFIGTARRITGPGVHEKWVLRIPPDLLAVEIFATAFDKAGNIIGKKSLPYTGASALCDALYGKK